MFLFFNWIFYLCAVTKSSKCFGWLPRMHVWKQLCFGLKCVYRLHVIFYICCFSPQNDCFKKTEDTKTVAGAGTYGLFGENKMPWGTTRGWVSNAAGSHSECPNLGEERDHEIKWNHFNSLRAGTFLLTLKLFIDCFVLDHKYPQKKSWKEKEVWEIMGITKKMFGAQTSGLLAVPWRGAEGPNVPGLALQPDSLSPRLAWL